VAGLLALPAGSARAADSAIRIGGDDRIETSVAISQAAYPVAGSAKAVVIARADDFADALAGTPFAVFQGGPLLITGKDRLDVRVSQEIRRVLGVNGQVFVLGGASALSPAVVGDVLTLNFNPVRIAGTDRFDTALRIAELMGPPLRVLLCSGLSFADALSAGAAAAATRGIVLLTNGATLPPEVGQFMVDHPGAEYFAVGGPAVTAAPGATPIAGIDRYDTAVKVAERLFPNPVVAGVANGEAFPDGLSGGAMMGKVQGPLLLVKPAGDLVPVVDAYLRANALTIATLNVFGGANAVSDFVIRQMTAAIL
jgi:putative cell wall-binding protein